MRRKSYCSRCSKEIKFKVAVLLVGQRPPWSDEHGPVGVRAELCESCYDEFELFLTPHLNGRGGQR